MWRPILICIVWSCFSKCKASHIVKTHFVFWNSSNPIFRLDNTDHVIDVNVNNSPMEYDQLNIICPSNNTMDREEEEHHIIYIVTREEFQACQVRSKKPKIVAVCNQPRKFQYFTITFRNFSPTPGGLEFRPGQSYYLISTSALGDIARREGGFCSSHNMKIIFKVADHQRKSEPVTAGAEGAEISPDAGEELRTLGPAMRDIASPPPHSDLASTSSAPQYFYRSKTLRKMPTEINYFYSLRDLFQLRKAFIEKIEKNETLKAEKLLSSSKSNHFELLNNIICLSMSLLFALQLV